MYSERVPVSAIKKMRVYVNSGKKSISEIVAEEDPDIALTGVFYSSGRWSPVCPVKADGKVLYADAKYTYQALGWSTGADVRQIAVPPGGCAAVDSYAANCILVNGGLPQRTLYYGGDVGGRRGRVGIGLSGDLESLIILGTPDGASDALTPEMLRDYFVSAGSDFAIMMDGGGKVNLYIRRQNALLEGRDPSQTLILIWLNEKGDDMGVKQYSVSRDGGTYLSANFRVKEFACNDGSDTVLISDELVTLLQKIRDHFGKATVINSGYRTESYNKKVGGATNSQHVRGTAADIVVSGVSPLAVAQYAEFLIPTAGGIGVYQTFTHVDVRATRSRWDNRSGKEVVVSGWPGYSEETELDKAVSWATENSIMQGTSDGDLMLDQPLTRKQYLLMEYRQYQNGLK